MQHDTENVLNYRDSFSFTYKASVTDKTVHIEKSLHRRGVGFLRYNQPTITQISCMEVLTSVNQGHANKDLLIPDELKYNSGSFQLQFFLFSLFLPSFHML